MVFASFGHENFDRGEHALAGCRDAAAVAEVGIALDIRTLSPLHFCGRSARGAFELYSLRWIGGNEDPDIFEYAFDSAKFPPNGANRGYYSNPKVDALIDKARREIDPNVRKPLYAEVQRILADDLPYINLWYLDNVVRPQQARRETTPESGGHHDFHAD